jgi:hypothetical protein
MSSQQQPSQSPFSSNAPQQSNYPPQGQPQGYSQQPQGYQAQPPPGPPPRRADADSAFLPQGRDRTEQMEYMQSYEASAPQTEEDKDQETLRREFPGIDSSLIAAIYGDTKSLSATREMLGELASTVS